jgi:hypothetical protein
LHCDLLDRASLTTIILKMKLPYITWVAFVKRHVCEGGKFWH